MTEPAASPAAPTTLALKAGEYLFREGERHGALFAVESGQLELTRAIDGASQRLAVLGPGDVVGEDCAFARRAAGCSARAIAETVVVRVAAGDFRDLLRSRPEVGGRVIDAVGRRLLEARIALAIEPTAVLAAAGPGARLLHQETGATFPLPREGSAVVGRADPRTRFQPDIELSALDVGRSLSRRHAVLSREGDGFFVIEESRVANGTFVNGQRLKPGVATPIRDGDEVSFGLVRTLFKTT